jgi:tRNA threonylcarbamoyladenosine biosynthesis protein TsaB
LNILAFDTSTDIMSIAVGSNLGGTSQQVWTHTGPGAAQSSSTLLPTIQLLMAQAGLTFAALDAIAFGVGPGSFTGLRTSCAVAQGLGFASGRPVLGIDSLMAVAEDARTKMGSPETAAVLAMLDARMDEVYAAAWAWQSGAWLSTGAATLGKPEQLVVGADMLMAGNAFVAYGGRLERPGSTQHFALPAASAMLRLAPALWAAGRAVPAAQAMPHYIRDKVAKTTAERLAEQAAVAAPGAPA